MVKIKEEFYIHLKANKEKKILELKGSKDDVIENMVKLNSYILNKFEDIEPSEMICFANKVMLYAIKEKKEIDERNYRYSR